MKKIILIHVLLFGFVIGFSQISLGSQSKGGKWRVGGSIGFGGGNNGFAMNISPFVGYQIAPKLEGGVSAGYQYVKSGDYKTNLFSGGPYTNFYFAEGFFARGHYEYYTGTQKVKGLSEKFKFDESALWLGAGYQNQGAIRYQAGIMYNVLYNEDDSIFNSPIRPFGGIAVSL